ncbi:MAG: LbtU family siderophore porin [Desulfobulbaceae bacterium]|nr:LbtU family siderophore porin [Desulfobulbaceae bacterium]
MKVMRKSYLKRGAVVGLMAFGGFVASVGSDALAAAPEAELAQLKSQLEQLARQNQALSERIAELEKKEAEQPRTVALPESGAAATDENLIGKINDHVKLSGVLEADMVIGEDFDGRTSTDFSLSTAELLLEAEATEWARGAFGIEWLNDENKISVRETYVILGDTESIPVGIKAGRYYLPFGVWGGHTISDPLTKQAFRTRGNAVTVTARQAGFYVDAFGYNGDTDDGGDSVLEHYGFKVGYDLEQEESLTLRLAAGYMSSVFDSENLADYTAGQEVAAYLTPGFSFDAERSFLQADYVGGVALTAEAELAGFGLYAEYVTATEDYHMDYLMNGFPGEYESKPSAWHVELSYGFDVNKYPTVVALSSSGTEDLGGFLPETYMVLFGSVELAKGFFLKGEYVHAIDYDVEDGGSGDESDTVTLRLAYEF